MNDETNMTNPFAVIDVLETEINRLKRYEALVRFIARDYVELSHDKVYNEYFRTIRKCRKLVQDDWVEPEVQQTTVKDDF